MGESKEKPHRGAGKGKPEYAEPTSSLQKLYDLKVTFKPAGTELEFQNLWKERANNTNCSWFYARGKKCCNVIIHMWVQVIYLQLELLSIQQMKPKKCWYTADEKTFASLSALALLGLNDDHTI